MGLGVALGSNLIDALTSPMLADTPTPLPGWSTAVAIVFVAFSCTVLYLGRMRTPSRAG